METRSAISGLIVLLTIAGFSCYVVSTSPVALNGLLYNSAEYFVGFSGNVCYSFSFHACFFLCEIKVSINNSNVNNSTKNEMVLH